MTIYCLQYERLTDTVYIYQFESSLSKKGMLILKSVAPTFECIPRTICLDATDIGRGSALLIKKSQLENFNAFVKGQKFRHSLMYTEKLPSEVIEKFTRLSKRVCSKIYKKKTRLKPQTKPTGYLLNHNFYYSLNAAKEEQKHLLKYSRWQGLTRKQVGYKITALYAL